MTKEEKSLSADIKTGDEHPIKEKSTRQRGQKREKVKPLTKIIIRHLPPTMTEEEFLKQIDPLPEHDFYYFAAADWSLGYDATCRAYLNLKNYDDVFLFRDRFDGYVFVDSKGAEYPAIVEFAPFQGLVKNKSRKTDPKVNTIELETHYKNFLTKLEEDRELAAKGGESKLEFSLDRKKEEKITSTPLLQYLANKKEKRREESKRRTEEKRRQREEEKERRLRNQQQVTKIMTGQDGGGKKDTTAKSVGGKENADNPPEEQKNSRSKRRLERNQRRREAYEQKKREKEILDREQKEKGTSAGKADETKFKTETAAKSEESAKSSRNIEENKSNEDINRRESKKYSERRERDRNRNRKEKEKEKDRPKDAITQGNTTAQAAKSSKESLTTPGIKEEEVSESVKNFIRSVVTVKEFIPKHKQIEAEQRENALKASTDEKPDTQVGKEQSEKTSEVENDDKITADRSSKSKSESSDIVDERQTQKQRLAEERRIRNKDRPSIAIYQPKPRQRQSEESDTNAVKEARSNPTSDCESVKKDEHRVKKVSRYSERRSERRSKDKRKDSLGDISNFEQKPELRKSKSHDDSTSELEKPAESQEVANKN